VSLIELNAREFCCHKGFTRRKEKKKIGGKKGEWKEK
jgi:hypothetical protein